MQPVQVNQNALEHDVLAWSSCHACGNRAGLLCIPPAGSTLVANIANLLDAVELPAAQNQCNG